MLKTSLKLRYFALKEDLHLCRSTSSVPEVAKIDKREDPPVGKNVKKQTRRSLLKYLSSAPHLKELKAHIPHKYLVVKRHLSAIENMYLINSETAKDIAKRILPIVKTDFNGQVVAETNAGLGLVTVELLKSGVKLIRLYESCSEFREALMKLNNDYPGRIELFTKNLFYSYVLNYLDKIDSGNRVEQILKGVPKRNWSDDPVMLVTGPMPNLSFVRYLIKSLALQSSIVKYGRIRFLPIMQPRHYMILSGGPEQDLHTYRTWSVLFQLLFDFKVIEKYPRKDFVPWENRKMSSRTRYPGTVDVDKLYLVDMCFKKELPVPNDQILPLLYFVRQFSGSGRNPVIPTIEKWIPDCGLNILLPQCEHGVEYPKEIDIFTQFCNLNPQEILCLFREVVAHPGYQASPFTAMVESLLVKTETVESDYVDHDRNISKE